MNKHKEQLYAWDERFINAWNKAEDERKEVESVKPKEEQIIESPEKLSIFINQKEFKL